mmetsp:Transcript_27296/g.51190  ORF Transcript_27296/g.51190 Transcript_27296/m.51190 type:complete len:130 (-) Transcript_27296:28-417(-)
MDDLSKAENDILVACRRLENAFNEKREESGEGDAAVPNPIKMVRRLTALEVAMQQLRKDCEKISKKRNTVVQSVIARQAQNVAHVEELFQAARLGDLDCEDPNWTELSNDLQHQSKILNKNAMMDEERS